MCCADPQLYLRDHQSSGSDRGASISPAARERYRDSRQPHPNGRRYVTMAYNNSALRYCTVLTAAFCKDTDQQPARSKAHYIKVCVFLLTPGGTVYQPVTVVTPQGQVVTQALSPGTIRVQNNQVVHLSL